MFGRRDVYTIVWIVSTLSVGQAAILAEPQTLSIHISHDCKKGPSYTLNDSHLPTKDVMTDLNLAMKTYGRGLKVNVIGHKGTTVEDLIDCRVMAMKIGFDSVKVYWMAESTGKMIEIGLDGPAFPATSTPR
jgi:hypothetical protein